MKFITKPLTKVGRFFLLIIILPTYKIYLTIKKIANKFYAPQFIRHKLVHPFSRRYLIHLVIILISFLTLASNLNAYEARRDDLGRGSIVASLVTTQDLGIIEEEGPIANTKRVTRYLGQTGVENKPQLTEGGTGEEAIPSTVTGGAVVKPILSPVEESLRQRDEIVYYTIQLGDTISEIAEKFGVTSNTILWENNLTAYSIIRPGDKLAILPTAGIRHTVVKGDNIEKIAKKYSIDGEAIIEANKLASADDIQIGEKLIIPGGKKPYIAPTYTIRTAWYEPPAKVESSGDMIWPSTCRRLTQYFRWRHSGIDIACGAGKPIYASDSGKVIEAQGGWNGGYGLMITIDHGNGMQTLYGHNSKIYVKVGETVEKGQVIAAEGSTGRSTGPHLHFEVRVGGVRKNPLSYVQ
ncbi:MAG: hypothetical protein A3J62_02675 [Candidatus Buchananbacteria bacterium RIFCSPHIGHO2_02_FULL_38_8]|uniref:LysM domain-containing protein n=2 Tax=Candidatus Buchananiibacteriota TaxID=1817903 RepID=A0A1G1XYX7_9BACT|nr:MAG: hypothetical protein A2731_01830 [Candidatus Buchananbacteria bacterium RIFCSPHIGHO2_01_FULL_39_8]OGY47559.1 MAG: hypothetical protein A3J62_02675 [Candidatus Buchananbacteria bacterium RIFCSPHIGHO2_02_FULL_38_8]